MGSRQARLIASQVRFKQLHKKACSPLSLHFKIRSDGVDSMKEFAGTCEKGNGNLHSEVEIAIETREVTREEMKEWRGCLQD